MKKNNLTNLENIKICIIGLGYVGLPLAIEFGKKYQTIGYDINQNRIDDLRSGLDKTLEIDKGDFDISERLLFTSDIQSIKKSDIFIITVPTPIDSDNNPDMSYLKSASELVGSVLNKGNIVVYESTVYPGATEEYCIPILNKSSGLQYNSDYFCGYSPERINPGDKKHTIRNIVKITSGSNPEIANLIDSLYSSIIPAGTYKASSIAVAEAAKVIENIQRDVNIALINELAIIFDKIKINTNEVLEAAGSKWNFINFQPGLVGGHCIGVDPYYLTHKSIETGYRPEMILAGRKINENMSNYIVNRIVGKMKKLNVDPLNARVAVLGLTFKENCPDIRNSKVFKIIEYLNDSGCKVLINDPWVDKEELRNSYKIDLVEMSQIKDVDVVVIAVGHDSYKEISLDKWAKTIKDNGIIVDIKSIYSNNYFNSTNIHYWCL